MIFIQTLQTEPVAVQSAITAVLAMLIGLGILHITDVQMGLIVAAVTAVLGLFTRSQVTPVATLPTTPNRIILSDELQHPSTPPPPGVG